MISSLALLATKTQTTRTIQALRSDLEAKSSKLRELEVRSKSTKLASQEEENSRASLIQTL